MVDGKKLEVDTFVAFQIDDGFESDACSIRQLPLRHRRPLVGPQPPDTLSQGLDYIGSRVLAHAPDPSSHSRNHAPVP
jgi:hypothetical protein